MYPHIIEDILHDRVIRIISTVEYVASMLMGEEESFLLTLKGDTGSNVIACIFGTKSYGIAVGREHL